MKRAFMFVFAIAVASVGVAKWAMPSQVPVSRLIANAEAKVKENPQDGDTRFLLARLYSLKYAGESDQVGVYDPDSNPRLPQWIRIQVQTPAKRTSSAAAALWKSINQYEFAVQLLASDARVRLGQAWMFEEASKWVATKPMGSPEDAAIRQQSAKQWLQRATDGYRKSYELAKISDTKQDHVWSGLEDMASRESAANLLRLSGAKLINLSDAFRAELKGHVAELDKKPTLITPIVFPLDASTPYSTIDQPNAKVKFDLDGSGLPRRWSWISPQAAFLCWNPLGDGKIDSARDLFGNATFWMFFQNGFDALASLDDNRDGFLGGKELRFISVWHDRNSNGISDPGEVQSLARYGIVRIAVRADGRKGNVWHKRSGLTLMSGRTLPLYDWVARRQK